MRHKSRDVLKRLFPVLCALLLAACGSGGGGAGGNESPGGLRAGAGRVAILLTDAPSQAFDEVNVTVTAVYLLADGEQVQVFHHADGVTRNLLELRDSAALWFDVAEVPGGEYDKIRLEVARVELVRYERNADGNIVTEDADGDGVATPVVAAGFPVEAKLSSRKIDLNPQGTFSVAEGDTLVLQVDLDVLRSIHVVENRHGTEYNFRPVVFVTVLAGEELGRLVRLSGWVTEVTEADFSLCRNLLETGEWGGCTRVDVAGASLFDADGAPVEIPADQTLQDLLAAGDYVTAVGRYTAVVQAARAARGGHDLDTEDHTLRRFLAEVVEIGTGPTSWSRYNGEITGVGPLDGDCVGVFTLLLDRGQALTGNLELPVHLYAGTRLFSPAGDALVCGDLEVGQRATVDAVLQLGEPDVLKAALVMVEPAIAEPEVRIDGTLVAVAEDGILQVERGDPTETLCAALRPGVLPLLYGPAEGALVALELTAEHQGLPIALFGDWEEDVECFSVGAAVVTAPLPEPEPAPES